MKKTLLLFVFVLSLASYSASALAHWFATCTYYIPQSPTTQHLYYKCCNNSAWGGDKDLWTLKLHCSDIGAQWMSTCDAGDGVYPTGSPWYLHNKTLTDNCNSDNGSITFPPGENA